MNLRDNIIFRDFLEAPPLEHGSEYVCTLCAPRSSSNRVKDIEHRYAVGKMNSLMPYTTGYTDDKAEAITKMTSALKSAMKYYSYSGVVLFGNLQCDGCSTLIYKLIMNHMTAFIKLGLTR
jgi:hypothetical protein